MDDQGEVQDLRNEYSSFVIESYPKRPDGTYMLPPGFQQQLIGEIVRIPELHLHQISTHVIRASANHQQLVDDAYNNLVNEYNTACLTWDSLSEELQQAEVQEIEPYIEAFGRISTRMLTFWTGHMNTIRGIVRNQNPPFGQQPFRMDNLFASINLRAQQVDAAWVQVQRDRELYHHPSQSPRLGVKVLGRQRIPRAVYELARRQVLPPAPTVSNRPLIPTMAFLPSEAGRHWVGSAIGAGGMGSARVFVETDAQGATYGRVVIKDTFPAASDTKFQGHSKWHGDLTRDGWKDSCIPLEYHTQRLVGNASQSVNSVKIVSSPQVDWAQRIVRIYMEYAPEGDLSDLLYRHQGHDEPVPEKFLWFLFKGLLDACMVMKRGGVNNAVTPWSEIVHCDLKLHNVFLGLAHVTHYPQWPIPKVGDFGLAFVTSQTDETNPSMRNSTGTPGFMASEQREYRDSMTKQPIDQVKILSACNVYGIAAVMFSLMELRFLHETDQPSFLPGMDPDQYTFGPMARALYSIELCGTIERCLRADPRQRPSVEILKRIFDGRLASADWHSDRQGVVQPQDDMLLLPNHPVKLRWASRILDGVDGLGRTRIPRVPGSSSTTYSESDSDDDVDVDADGDSDDDEM